MVEVFGQVGEGGLGAFRAYDVRGEYGVEITEGLAFAVGRALVVEVGAKRIVFGRDMRGHGVGLAEALAAGIRYAGATAIDLGVISTPMCYFANVELGADAGVMVTASHNPAKDNGLKVTRAGAVPMGYASGLKALQGRIRAEEYGPAAATEGRLERYDIRPAYWAAMRGHAAFVSKPRVVMDFGNGMGSVEMGGLLDLFEAEVLYGELDGSFPNHPANPLRAETLVDLQGRVRASGAAFGVAFDGDADRLGFVDGEGRIIRIDLVTGVLAAEFLRGEPGAAIVHDVRTGRAVREYIREHGGRPIEWRVGHAFMKAKMRDVGSPFGGELAGHYYFRELGYSESAALVLILIANVLEREGVSLAELFAPLQGMANSGEINIAVGDGERIPGVLGVLREAYGDGDVDELDGIRVEFDDWWFNVRGSNTEPYLRVIVEAESEGLLGEKVAELRRVIGGAA